MATLGIIYKLTHCVMCDGADGEFTEFMFPDGVQGVIHVICHEGLYLREAVPLRVMQKGRGR